MALNITAFMINELRAIIYNIIIKHFIGQFIFRYRSRDYARRWNPLHCWTIIEEYEAHGRRKADWQVALLRGRCIAREPIPSFEEAEDIAVDSQSTRVLRPNRELAALVRKARQEAANLAYDVVIPIDSDSETKKKIQNIAKLKKKKNRPVTLHWFVLGGVVGLRGAVGLGGAACLRGARGVAVRRRRLMLSTPGQPQQEAPEKALQSNPQSSVGGAPMLAREIRFYEIMYRVSTGVQSLSVAP
ncbi:hypothetical protein Purlil1_7140 [Purpureocillium lilacinum]|uniref:Uncharacterized protein n=1 Tax=Purpureocillium lilacinum TaxID=33203 RepID=A0ABR0BWV5_PURLI|nr:hypothetical protein Purlil1_7140 [Purpureocillium lilacinum]